jgi:hypothetical protein
MYIYGYYMYIYILYYMYLHYEIHMQCIAHITTSQLPCLRHYEGLVVGAILFRFCGHESHVTRGTCAVAARKMSTGGITWTGCVESL